MEKRIYGSYLLPKAIDKYISNKNIKNDISVSILKLLITIYGEASILGPYSSLSTTKLIENMNAFGYPPYKIEEFFDLLNDFDNYLKGKKHKTNLLEKIYKEIIDMIFYKNAKKPISQVEFKFFESLLGLNGSKNLAMKVFNILFNKNFTNVEHYWKLKLYQIDHTITLTTEIDYLLDKSIYEKYGMDYDFVKKMSKNQVLELNRKIKEDEEEAINGGRSKGVDKPKILTYSSGNVVVDSLLLIGFLSTQLLVLYLIALRIYG